ncbi:hypothetical protein UFOVP181_92 [uncultured Caudovirales phage]|uniref:Uncharacterized protein n=1 Tax=uncultured Caudovirales phage TaxID=2100421 RepID=A0A6J7WIH6_9CAUD|nr:hypothetical protein UFOVP57_70 [uncultured Caudovirales phage]CAB5208627.1 hypothetical protein UFOVP181_92 [uncultured Caudovirales phage]
MRLNELSPVHYHDTLNPLIWEGTQLKTEVRYKLLAIAHHFAKFLNVPKLNLRDITISGSNAAFGYSDSSDLDLHLVVDMPKDKPELAELYTAKKNNYNFAHNITVKGIDVELYVQDVQQPHHSAGIYSILNDKWLTKPKHQPPNIEDREVTSKARNYSAKINQAMRSNDLNTAKETMADIRRLRQAGLEAGGEYSVENLAFKLLRSRGKIDKFVKHINKLQSAELSLGERNED